ncbi:MAG: hypothetical protein WBJ65_13580, partial [Candidatus Microthrix parvicella]
VTGCDHEPRSEEPMGKLIYAINTSLDGFSEDPTGAFDWSVLTRTYMSSTTNGPVVRRGVGCTGGL